MSETPGSLKLILRAVCVVAGLFMAVFGLVWAVGSFFSGRNYLSTALNLGLAIAGIGLLLTGLRSWKAWPYVLILLSIPWLLFAFGSLLGDPLLGALPTGAAAFAASALVRRWRLRSA